jgi:DNA-binding NtrC family response regulator
MAVRRRILAMTEPAVNEKKPRGLRLLVVEDDPGVSYAVCRWLQEENVQPVLAATVHEAMTMLQDLVFIEATCDAVLADYHLPDATGLRVIRAFCDSYPGLPVAMMSGASDLGMELWVKKWNIPLFRKPLKLDELRDWLAMVRLRLAS